MVKGADPHVPDAFSPSSPGCIGIEGNPRMTKRNRAITKGNTAMKKRLLSLTAISLSAFALCSCGGSKEDKTAD